MTDNKNNNKNEQAPAESAAATDRKVRKTTEAYNAAVAKAEEKAYAALLAKLPEGVGDVNAKVAEIRATLETDKRAAFMAATTADNPVATYEASCEVLTDAAEKAIENVCKPVQKDVHRFMLAGYPDAVGTVNAYQRVWRENVTLGGRASIAAYLYPQD